MKKYSVEYFKKKYEILSEKLLKREGFVDEIKAVRKITNEMYDKKVREYKERQGAILTEMRIHSDADEEFYLTANTVLNVAKRALDIFKSSEVPEKRQLLNFLLQNCELQGKELVFSLRSPFDKVLATRNHPIGLRR
ncbi:MAG: hypothetical protein WC246_00955 [Candidatus Paceibacterota bacterium]